MLLSSEVPVVPADPIVTPEEGTISFVSPSEVLDLVDYSPSFDSDPSEDSLPPAPDLPLVSPFLCSDNTEADGESEPAKAKTPNVITRYSCTIIKSPPYNCCIPLPGIQFDVTWRLMPTMVRLSLSVDLIAPILTGRISCHLARDVEVVTDIGISEGVVAHPEDGVGMGFEITASDVREDDKEFEVEASAIDTRKIIVDPLVISDSSKSSRGEVYIDRITEIETTQRQLETSQMVASRERASLVERIGSLRLEYLKEEFHQVRRDRDDTQRRLRRIMTITCFGMTPEAIEELINRRVEEKLAAHEATRAANALEAENQIITHDRPVARECTYQDFMKCQPLNFKGTEGVVRLIRWFKKMETVFHISNCPEKDLQVRSLLLSCTLLNSALTW
ncbi:hypothetical protein Tco_0173197 [Tanacetum coccineum]